MLFYAKEKTIDYAIFLSTKQDKPFWNRFITINVNIKTLPFIDLNSRHYSVLNWPSRRRVQFKYFII